MLGQSLPTRSCQTIKQKQIYTVHRLISKRVLFINK